MPTGMACPHRRSATIAIVIAFSAMWPSTAFAQTPAMRAHIQPAPNAFGWNNSAVTVVFDCQAVAPCPPDATVNEEGSGLSVSRLSFSTEGRTIEAATSIHIDRTAPIVRIAAPARGAVTDDAVTKVNASATDELSGLAAATCNGRPAQLSGASVDCEIALGEGDNDVIVVVRDKAGNTASAATRIFRRSRQPVPYVVPSLLAMRVGQQYALQIIDRAGEPIGDATVVSTDGTIVEVLDHSIGLIAARRPGKAQIIVRSKGQSATTDITVVAGAFPFGMTVWKGGDNLLPEFTEGLTLQPERVPGGAALLWLEMSANGQSVIRATSADPPTVLWIEWPAIAADERVVERMLDHTGGALLILERRSGSGSAIVRVGRPAAGALWRYESQGRLDSDFAMGWDGTLYIVETPADGFPQVVGINSETGVAQRRVPIPRLVKLDPKPGCEPRRSRPVAQPPHAGPPTLPEGGAAAVLFVADVTSCDGGPESGRRAVNVLRIWPDGTSVASSLVVLDGASARGNADTTLFRVVPDGRGGVLAPMRLRSGRDVVHRVVRIAGNQRSEYDLPAFGEYVLGEDWAYTTDGHTLVAFDPVTGRVAWTQRPGFAMKIQFAMAGGGVAIESEEGVRRVEGNGQFGKLLIPRNGMKDLQPIRRP